MSYTKRAPTKNQRIMESIEASIAADKLKKKKEPVSKVASMYRNVEEPKGAENTENRAKTPITRFFGSSANSMTVKTNYTSSSPLVASNAKSRTFKEWIAARNTKKLSMMQVPKCDVPQNELNVKAELIGERERFEEEISKLKTDHDIKEKQLTEENNSLKFDLELKMEKLLELRKQNELLDDAVSSIPQKDAEIQKLSHRNVNLSSDLCYQRNISKALLEELNMAQKESINLKLANDALLQENEVLRYRLAEQSSPTSLLYMTANQSPSCMLSEKRDSYSSFFRSSVTPPRSGNTLKGKSNSAAMFRNTFMSEGRRRTLKTPTKIFTPEGVTEVNDPSKDGRRVSRRINLQTDASPVADQIKTPELTFSED